MFIWRPQLIKMSPINPTTMNKNQSHLQLPLIVTIMMFALLLPSCTHRENGDSISTSSKYFYVDETSRPETVAYAKKLTDFVEKLLHDKTTFDADLSAQLEKLNITLHTSPDGKLKIYTWWNGEGGNLFIYNSIYQTTCNNKFKAGLMEEYEPMPLAIYQVESSNGPVYLIQFCFRESSSYYAIGLDAFKVSKKGELEPAKVFECPSVDPFASSSYADYVCIETSLPSLPPSVSCKGGWLDDFFFGMTKKDIYMPHLFSDSEQHLSEIWHDYYFHYKWDGDHFNRDALLTYNPKLKKYLDGEGQLMEEFELGGSIVRIEKVEDDGSYRYIAWKKKKLFSAAPDLVITQGWYHELKHEYYFKNGEYEYIFNNDSQNLRIMYTNPKTNKTREFANYDVYSEE